MKPRIIPKNTFIGESVLEASFIASKGIDETKAPTQRDAVAVLKNLEINYDGSVSPRKPIWAVNQLSNVNIFIGSTFNGDFIFLAEEGGKYNLVVYSKDDTEYPYIFDEIKLHNTDISIVNTTSSTIIQNCNIGEENLATFKLYVKDDEWELEKMIISINNMEFVDGNPQINPNLMLSNPLQFRDVYDSSAIAALGILAYIELNEETGQPELVANTPYNQISVKSLTESTKFGIIESIPKNAEFNTIFLKCFMNNIRYNNPGSSIWMRWEKTRDGVYWEDFEHLEAGPDVILIKIPDYVTNITMSENDAGVTPKTFKRYSPLSEEDNILSRPDVIMLQDPVDLTYSYRCLVYILKSENETTPSVTLDGDYILQVDGTTYNGNAIIPVYSASRQRTFTLKFKVEPAEGITLETDPLDSDYYVAFDISHFTCIVKTKNSYNSQEITYNVDEPNSKFTIELEGEYIKITGNVTDTALTNALTYADEYTKELFWKYNTKITVFYNNIPIGISNLEYHDTIPIYPLKTMAPDMSEHLLVELNGSYLRSNTFNVNVSYDVYAHLDNGIVKNTTLRGWYRVNPYYDLTVKIPELAPFGSSLSNWSTTRISYDISAYGIKIRCKDKNTERYVSERTFYRGYSASAGTFTHNGVSAETFHNTDLSGIKDNADALLWFFFESAFTGDFNDYASYVERRTDYQNLQFEIAFARYTYGGASYGNFTVIDSNYKYNLFGNLSTYLSLIFYVSYDLLMDGRHFSIMNNNSEDFKILDGFEELSVSDLKYYGISCTCEMGNYSNKYLYFNDNSQLEYALIWENGTLPVVYSPYSGGEFDLIGSLPGIANIDDTAYDMNQGPESVGLEGFQLGMVMKNPFLRNTSESKFEILKLDLGENDANKGYKLYWKHRIVSYGAFNNNILFSNSDSLVTPLLNTLTLDASQDSEITIVTPWRNYLVAATKEAVYLVYEMGEGFGHKVVNTFIGVPKIDRRTCKAILNGIIFKSNNKIYTLQPGVYSTDDSILNIAEISQPIEKLLTETINLKDQSCQEFNFAISTSKYYYVFLPGCPSDKTTCFKYDYVRKVWTTLEFPIVIKDYIQTTEDDLYVIDTRNRVYAFEQNFTEFVKWFNGTNDDEIPDRDMTFGDYIDGGFNNVTPISFSLDSGQKTDNISTTKQFVETKMIVATMDNMDSFPLDIAIYIDGINFKNITVDGKTFEKIHVDINTDGAVLKRTTQDGLILNTNTTTDDIDLVNTMRQFILRYSGKGKSIRHIVSGETLYDFKIYVTYYRYKLTHNKQ